MLSYFPNNYPTSLSLLSIKIKIKLLPTTFSKNHNLLFCFIRSLQTKIFHETRDLKPKTFCRIRVTFAQILRNLFQNRLEYMKLSIKTHKKERQDNKNEKDIMNLLLTCRMLFSSSAEHSKRTVRTLERNFQFYMMATALSNRRKRNNDAALESANHRVLSYQVCRRLYV